MGIVFLANVGNSDLAVENTARGELPWQARLLAERLEAVRETAITVNHEINNPLMTILATAQVLLLSQDDLNERTRERLKVIEREVKRIAEVTRRLQTLDELKTDDYIAEGPKMIDLGMDGSRDSE